IEPDRCPQRAKAPLPGVVADGVFELLERVPRVLLQAADALRSGAMLDSEDRTEDRASEVSHSVKTLEQLTAAQPAGRVVDPDPEAVLDPLEIRLRPDGGGLIHRLAERAGLAFPDHQGIFATDRELGDRHDFQVDVLERRSLQPTHPPWLPHILPAHPAHEPP